MSLDLLEILKVGGPVFALAALIILLADRHVRMLLKLLSNHLTHVEKEMARSSAASEATRGAIERLVDRIDKVLFSNVSSD